MLEHVYEGERCMFCNVNVYDNMLYNEDDVCPGRVDGEPIFYSTSTPDPWAHVDLDTYTY